MRPLAPDHPLLRKYSSGHRVRLLRDGAETYPAMLEAIEAARRSVCLESYIVKPDRTGQRFAKALVARACAGVEVNLLYDGLGSLGLPATFVEGLRRGGVRTAEFNPPSLFRGFRKLNRRNHRKALIVDSSTGFVGGINLSDEYAPAGEGGGGWRDTHLRIEGPAVRDLEALFFRTWFRSGGAASAVPLAAAPARPEAGVLVRILGSRTFRERRMIRSAYLRAISLADERILITNAYFLPDPILVRALRRAARRGAEVRVIFGGRASDVPWVGHAAQSIFGRLLRANVHLHEWQGANLHAKTAVVDGLWSTVGSFNLDYRSLLHNLEVNAGILDPAFGKKMEAMFREDLARTGTVTLETWKSRTLGERIRDWIAYRFRFLL